RGPWGSLPSFVGRAHGGGRHLLRSREGVRCDYLPGFGVRHRSATRAATARRRSSFPRRKSSRMTTALVLMDLQVGLLTGEGAVPEADALLGRLRPLAERARALGVPVVHIQDDDLGDVGSEEWRIDPRLGARGGDLRVRKAECDACHETGPARPL